MAEQTETLRSALTKFYQTAEDLGLHLSWQKTNVQNLGAGDPAADITVAKNTIEAVTEFRYMGSIQSSSGRCYPDLHRRIGVASSAMLSMQRCMLASKGSKSGHQAKTIPNSCSPKSCCMDPAGR